MSCSYNIEISAPASFHTEKKEEFRLSRYALSKLTNNQDLEVTNHLHLKSDPTTKVSISHTKGAGAAMISKDPNIESVGIDIEWSTRPVKPGIEKFFLSENDITLSLLEVWMIKEAAYKAFFPLYTGEKVLVLKDFTITDDSFEIEGTILGQYKVEKQLINGKELLIATAWI